MLNGILGFHHVTAVAGAARRNLLFYTQLLGLRLLKKTINSDDPGTYQFYFGDAVGAAGTILSSFPWQYLTAGRPGSGQATEVACAVPAASLAFWQQRFAQHGVPHRAPVVRFGEQYLYFQDPDGLRMAFVASPPRSGPGLPWTTANIGADVASLGLHSVTLTLADSRKTVVILTTILGFRLVARAGRLARYALGGPAPTSFVDVEEAADAPPGQPGGGTVHHVAFGVANDAELALFQTLIAQHGYNVTPILDRHYFRAIYFQEPGGVLFAIATVRPGFATDESFATLGTRLQLPPHFEDRRSEIESRLPSLD